MRIRDKMELNRLVATMAAFLNENVPQFDDWVEDNRQKDSNVEDLANFLEEWYNS